MSRKATDMTGKAGVDDSVVERRLRPIYEWLDQGHNRKAIQECDKVLKKQPGLNCARVLRGLALLRSGKAEDAEECICQVEEVCPTDDSTLQALTIYYREIHELDRICLVYEKATEKQSRNEELLSHLFMSYVRVGNYKKQQQTAMTLYKLKPKNPYYFWAVISIVMQAREHSTEDSSRQVCLTLAERMVGKFFKEGKLEAEAEVLTYLYILELQNKYVDALDILDSDLSEKITQQPANFLQLKRVHYHMQLKQWQQAHAICRDLIELERDNWQHYEAFCTSLLHLHCGGTEDLSVLEEGVSYLRKTLRDSEVQHGTKYRAPYLALLQLVYQLDSAGLAQLVPRLGVHVGEEMAGYLKHYGSKWCAFSDVRRFFSLVPEASVPALLQQLRDFVELDDATAPLHVHMLHRHLTWLQVSRCLQAGPDSTPEQHLATADELLRLYNSTHHLACQSTATDTRRNDLYLLLCSHSVLHALTLLQAARQLSSDCGSSVSSDSGISINASNTSIKSLLHTTPVTNCTTTQDSSQHTKQLNSTQHTVPDNPSQHTTELNTQHIVTDNTPQHTKHLNNTQHTAPDLTSQRTTQLNTTQRNSTHTNSQHPSPSELLVKLAGVLEAGIASSGANFQLKLLLLQVYNMIGACGSLLKCYTSLEIKSVQLDTLGHVAALQALDACNYSFANYVFTATNGFFLSVAKDTCEPMIQAYKYGSLIRLPEFAAFRERLENSVHFATVTAEQMMMELTYTVVSHKAALGLLQQQEIDPVKDRTEYDKLVDNTHYTDKIAWQCVRSASHVPLPEPGTAHDTKPPRPAALEELKLRNATLRLLGAAYKATGHSNDAACGADCGVQQLAAVVRELEQLVAAGTGGTADALTTDCTQRGCTRMAGLYKRGSYVSCVLLHANMLLHIHACHTVCGADNQASIAWQPCHVAACQKAISALLSSATAQLSVLQCTATTAVLSNAIALHALHHTLQTVGIACILLGLGSTILRRTKSGRKKQKKKKPLQTQTDGAADEYQRYIIHLEDELERLQSSLSTKVKMAKANSLNNSSRYASLDAKFSSTQSSKGNTTDADTLGLEQLTLDDRLPNGHDVTQKCVLDKLRPDYTDIPTTDSLEPSKPDFVQTCSTIDSSYEESLDNLKTGVAAKIKYLCSIKL